LIKTFVLTNKIIGGNIMKRYDELTNEELAKLSDSQISTLIDYECALEGIPLLPERPVAPESKNFNPDLTVYNVKGMYFPKKEDAIKVLSVLTDVERVSSKYTSGGYSGDRIIAPLDSYEKIELNEEKWFSKELYATVQEEKGNNDRRLKQYTDAQKEYDDTYKLRIDIVKNVMDAIHEAQDEEYKKQKYTREYIKYLKLSEGNKDIALNFLENAHCEVVEIEGFIDSLKDLEV
jgi:hypothetical protein